MAFLQACISLGGVVALVLLAGVAARRFSAKAGLKQDPTACQLTATLTLDAKRRVHLLETRHGAVMVLTGGGADQLLMLPAEIPKSVRAA
jgi:hypothetical protein